MVPVLLLSAMLATAHLADDAIWFDEWITYFITGTGEITNRNLDATPCGEIQATQIPPLDMLCLAAIDNSWPPAFFSLLVVWDRLVSFGALVSDRMLALLIGLLSVGLIYRLGRRMFDYQTGIIAALLLGTNAFFLYYMHEVRGYTLYVLFPALNGWLYWRLLTSYDKTRRRVRWGFALSITGALYTHYIAAAAVLGIAIYHVIFERPAHWRQAAGADPERERWVGILKLWFNGCLLYAPWLAVLVVSFINESLTERSLDTITLLRNTMYGFTNNLQWLAIPLLLLTLRQWRTRQIRFLFTWMLTIGFVAMLGNIYADFLFHPRHIMGAMPAMMLLVAAGIRQIGQVRRELAWLAVGVWVGVGWVYSATPDFMTALPRHISTVPLSAMNTIVETVEQCAMDTDLIVLGIDTPEDEWIHSLPVDYYLPDREKLTLLGLLVTDESENDSPLLPEDLYAADYATRVSAMTAGAERVWLFTLPDLPLQREMLMLDDLLQSQRYQPCGFFLETDNLSGQVYTSDQALCQQVLASCSEQ